MAINSRRALYPLCAVFALIAGCATGAAVTDQSIEDQVLTRIAQEPRMSSAQLTVREEEGAVSIGGFIDTLEQKSTLDSIVADVSGIDGVMSVKDNTTMQPGTE